MVERRVGCARSPVQFTVTNLALSMLSFRKRALPLAAGVVRGESAASYGRHDLREELCFLRLV